MTTPANLANSQGFTILGGNSGGQGFQFFTLYELGPTVAERIDSIYMVLPCGTNAEQNSVASIQLLATNQDVLYEQAAPFLKPSGVQAMTVYGTWSRFGRDTPQDPLAQVLQASDNNIRAYFNSALPDLILPPLSTVVFVANVDDGGEGGDIVVGPVAISTKKYDSTAATSTLANLTPFLLPASNS